MARLRWPARPPCRPGCRTRPRQRPAIPQGARIASVEVVGELTERGRAPLATLYVACASPSTSVPRRSKIFGTIWYMPAGAARGRCTCIVVERRPAPARRGRREGGGPSRWKVRLPRIARGRATGARVGDRQRIAERGARVALCWAGDTVTVGFLLTHVVPPCRHRHVDPGRTVDPHWAIVIPDTGSEKTFRRPAPDAPSQARASCRAGRRRWHSAPARDAPVPRSSRSGCPPASPRRSRAPAGTPRNTSP